MTLKESLSKTTTLSVFVCSVVIMSSILEHMCADVFQQTGQCLRSVVEPQEPMPYRALLPLRQPIRQALNSNFRMALDKGWVDSSTLHLLEDLLHIGGVFWFTNNLVKVCVCAWREIFPIPLKMD